MQKSFGARKPKTKENSQKLPRPTMDKGGAL
jgi:hypothetical protein